jgi:hypothetical protein
MSGLPGSLRGQVDGVVAHLPTVAPGGPRDDGAAAAVNDERRAPAETFVGPHGDGLGLVRALLRTVPPWLAPGAGVVVSMQAWQWQGFSAEAGSMGFEASRVDVPSERGAVVTLRRTAEVGLDQG